MARQNIGTTRLAQRTAAAKTNANFAELYARNPVVEVTAATDDGSFIVPGGYEIASITISGNNANAVTGGVKLGKTAGATDIVAAQAVAANSINSVPNASILIKAFSKTADQTVYFAPVTGWNSASIDIRVALRELW